MLHTERVWLRRGRIFFSCTSAILIIIIGFCLPAVSQEETFQKPLVSEETPAPTGLPDVLDTPYDAGGSITIRWALSSDDGAGKNHVTGYDILRSETKDGEYQVTSSVTEGVKEYVDTSTEDKVDYYYRIRTRAGEFFADSPPLGGRPIQTTVVQSREKQSVGHCRHPLLFHHPLHLKS